MWMGFGVGTALLLSLIFECFIIQKTPYHEHMMHALPAQVIGSFTVCLCLWFWPKSRMQYLTIFSVFAIGFVASYGGYVLGGLGGMDGPFFYSIYMMPSFIMLIPCGFKLRVLGTMSTVSGFAGLFLIQQPQVLFPYGDITFSSMVIITSTCILLGHRNWIIMRERALAMYRLDVERQTKDVQNVELARRLRQQALRAKVINNELQEARSAVRVSIARDLHDDVGQILVGAKMELEMLDRKMEDGQQVDVDQIARLYDVMFGLEDSIRDMIHRLRDAQAPANLSNALTSLLRPYQLRHHIDVQMDRSLFESVSGTTSGLIYRVIQEGLTNAAKYSTGQCWRVVVERDVHGIRVAVEDQAEVAPRNHLNREGLGLLGLRERATLIGGTFDFFRRDGWTVLEVRLPISLHGLDDGFLNVDTLKVAI